MTDGPWLEAQRETARGISPMGVSLLEGEPCLCGSEHYTTRSECGYSDTMTYAHRCGRCGNEFKTWTEG